MTLCYDLPMHLRPNEKVLKVFSRHPFPYFIGVLKTVLLSLPFYFILSVLRGNFSTSGFLLTSFAVTGFFLLAVVYNGFMYWLDKLVVTNYRIIHVTWPFPTVRKEFETELHEIQDIATKEMGVLAHFKIFDYGTLKIETAASKVTIFFDKAPDPEGIKHFLYSSVLHKDDPV